MAVKSGLTRGRASALIRLCSLLSLILFAAGGLLLIAPVDEPATSNLAVASTRSAAPPPLQFTKFSELRGVRSSLFEFGQLQRASVQWREKPQPEPVIVAPTPAAPIEPPRPAPNVDGLQLVGTVPGTIRAFALISDATDQNVHTVARGEVFREAIVEDILSDRIVFSLNNQRAELKLTTLGDTVSSLARPPVAPVRQTSRPAPSASGAQPNKPKASLGMRGYMLTREILKEYKLTEPALLVTAVRQPDSPVQEGDIILSIESKKFSSIGELISIIETKSRGDTVLIGIQRDGRKEFVKARLS